MAAKVAGRAGADQLQTATGKAAAVERVAVVDVGRKRDPEHGRLREYGLDVADHEVTAVLFGRQHHEDRPRIVGRVVAQRRHGQLRVADAGGLQERDALDGRVSHTAGNVHLMRP